MSRGTIKKVAGPLVIAKGMRDANMYDVVRVSSQRLIGEIIEMHEDEASIQVYEETSGLRPGEPVESMEVPLSVELGPGLITSIYDGIQRPLDDIMKVAGSNNLKRGVEVPALKRDKKWNFIPVAKVGDQLEGGDVLGTVQETIVVTQKIMVPPNMKGTLKEIKSGEFTVDETVAVLSTADGDKELTLMQHWPVRRGRPYKKKLPPAKPLVTGQRVIDTMFPIAKGGVAAVPGPFGSGKTVIQHQLAKWAEADGDYQNKEMDMLLNKKPSIERLYQSLEEFGKDRKGIVYAINISHAQKITKLYQEHGVKAIAIDSKTPAAERQQDIEAFKKGDIQVLVNVDIFSEGFDCPDVEFVQLARPTLSLAKYLQMVGRGLRVAKGKKNCVIIDNVGRL